MNAKMRAMALDAEGQRFAARLFWYGSAVEDIRTAQVLSEEEDEAARYAAVGEAVAGERAPPARKRSDEGDRLEVLGLGAGQAMTASAIDELANCRHPEDQRQRCVSADTGSKFSRCSDCGAVRYEPALHWVRPVLVAHVVGRHRP